MVERVWLLAAGICPPSYDSELREMATESGFHQSFHITEFLPKLGMHLSVRHNHWDLTKPAKQSLSVRILALPSQAYRMIQRSVWVRIVGMMNTRG